MRCRLLVALLAFGCLGANAAEIYQVRFKASDELSETERVSFLNSLGSCIYYSPTPIVWEEWPTGATSVQFGKMFTVRLDTPEIYWSFYSAGYGGFVSGQATLTTGTLNTVSINPKEGKQPVTIKVPINCYGEKSPEAKLHFYDVTKGVVTYDGVQGAFSGVVRNENTEQYDTLAQDITVYVKTGEKFRYTISNVTAKDPATGKNIPHLIHTDSVVVGEGGCTITTDYSKTPVRRLRFNDLLGENVDRYPTNSEIHNAVYPYSRYAVLHSLSGGSSFLGHSYRVDEIWHKEDGKETYNYMEFYALPGKQMFWDYDFWYGSLSNLSSSLTIERGGTKGFEFSFDVPESSQEICVDFAKYPEFKVRFKNAWKPCNGDSISIADSPYMVVRNPNGHYFYKEDKVTPEMYEIKTAYRRDVNDDIYTWRVRDCFTQAEFKVGRSEMSIGANSQTKIVRPALSDQTLLFKDGNEVVYDLSDFRSIRIEIPAKLRSLYKFIKIGDLEISKDVYEADNGAEIDTTIVFLPMGDYTLSLIRDGGTEFMKSRSFKLADSYDQVIRFSEDDCSGLNFTVKHREDCRFTGAEVQVKNVETEEKYSASTDGDGKCKLILPDKGEYQYTVYPGFHVPIHGTVTVGEGYTDIAASFENYHTLTLVGNDQLSGYGWTTENHAYSQDLLGMEFVPFSFVAAKDTVINGTQIAAETPVQQMFAPEDVSISFGYTNVSTYSYAVSPLKADRTIVVPSGEAVRVTYKNAGGNRRNISTYALDWGGTQVIPFRIEQNAGRISLIPGIYKAVSEEEETVYFEVAGEALTIDFANPPTPPTGIEGVEADGNGTFVVESGVLRAEGFGKGTAVALYDAGGREVRRTIATAYGATLSLVGLPSGVYIVRAAGKSGKILLK